MASDRPKFGVVDIDQQRDRLVLRFGRESPWAGGAFMAVLLLFCTSGLVNASLALAAGEEEAWVLPIFLVGEFFLVRRTLRAIGERQSVVITADSIDVVQDVRYVQRLSRSTRLPVRLVWDVRAAECDNDPEVPGEGYGLEVVHAAGTTRSYGKLARRDAEQLASLTRGWLRGHAGWEPDETNVAAVDSAPWRRLRSALFPAFVIVVLAWLAWETLYGAA
jgi:hypothetical protein